MSLLLHFQVFLICDYLEWNYCEHEGIMWSCAWFGICSEMSWLKFFILYALDFIQPGHKSLGVCSKYVLEMTFFFLHFALQYIFFLSTVTSFLWCVLIQYIFWHFSYYALDIIFPSVEEEEMLCCVIENQ